jgi:hypothetical protein
MRYLLLIQKNEAAWHALTDVERAEWTKRYTAYGKRMFDAGIVRSGAILEHTDSATTVRVREGRRLVTDGPFAETSEQVAGICVIEVADLDEALRWAADHPDAAWASVEVRPVRWDSAPPGAAKG